MALAHGSYTWQLRMAVTHGSYTWQLRMDTWKGWSQRRGQPGHGAGRLPASFPWCWGHTLLGQGHPLRWQLPNQASETARLEGKTGNTALSDALCGES